MSRPRLRVATLAAALLLGAAMGADAGGGQSGGGQLGLADRFLDSFRSLKSPGRLARHGHEVFVRQTLSGGTYGSSTTTPRRPPPTTGRPAEV